LKEQDTPAYSDSLTVNGLSWRIKIYPNGIGESKGTYMAAFLELSKGFQSEVQCQYRIKLVSRYFSQSYLKIRSMIAIRVKVFIRNPHPNLIIKSVGVGTSLFR
jgi:hypothetical protein